MARLSLAQQSIVNDLDNEVFVAAGAGSGKTFTLVQRLVHGLERRDAQGRPFLPSVEDALIITFTNKAAGEIKGRIRAQLMALGRHEDALALDRAWVSTIHSMCERILRSSALELGVDPDFTVVGDHEAEYLRAQALDDVLRQVRGSEEFAPLFKACGAGYSEVSQAGVGRAGSGFNADDTAPAMALKLLEKATSSLKGFDSLAFRGEPCERGALVCGFVEAFDDFMAVYAPKSASAKDKKAAMEASLGPLRALDTATASLEELLSAAEGAILPNLSVSRNEDVKDLVRRLKGRHARLVANLRYDLEVAPLREPLLRLAKLVGDRYAQVKRERGAFDNSDLLREALFALTQNDDVRARFCGRFKLVMVDEFQDTDPQQLQIIRLLAASPDALCFVGDAQQSIYRFRGADVEQYRRAQEAADKRGSSHELAQNYRSHDDILRFVKFALGDTGVLEGFMDLTANPERADGYVAEAGERAGEPIEQPRVQVELTVARGNASQIKGEELVRANAAQIASRLQELHRQGVPAGSMALLLRRMTHCDVYLRELRDRGLDAVVTKGNSFATALEVRMVASLLTALANPYDTRAGLLPVLRGPLFELSNDDLALLAKGGDSTTLVNGVMAGVDGLEQLLGEKPGPRLAWAVEVIERARFRMGAQPVADTVLGVCAESGWLARLEGEGPAGRSRAANVMTCVRRIRENVDDAGLGFSHAPKVFEDWLATSKQGPAAVNAEGADAVSVMSVHGSKGLEFPVVAVAECFDDSSNVSGKRLALFDYPRETVAALKAETFDRDKKKKQAFSKLCGEAALATSGAPRSAFEWRVDVERREAAANAQEAARLVYVALTRAREALVVGMTLRQPAKSAPDQDAFSPALANTLACSMLGGSVPAALAGASGPQFDHWFDYGGSASGDLRVVTLMPPDADKPDEPELEEEPEPRTFKFYREKRSAPPIGTWSPRDGVRSYSSDSKAALARQEREARLAAGEVLEEAVDEETWSTELPDPLGNRALAFGDAFHELARLMAQQRAMPSPERVRAVARYRRLDAGDEGRLEEALERWWESDLRREAFSYPTLDAEEPFFQPIEGTGEYLTGSIDLLATKETERALVVDYKTGERRLTAQEARELHEMQARYYARVLLNEGYDAVECAFVLVENVDGQGRPLVARYRFDQSRVPSLGA